MERLRLDAGSRPEEALRNRRIIMKLVAKVDIQALPAPIHEAFFNYIQTFWKHGKLDPQIKELIRMRSAVMADCKQ